jgi:hypothetical protein
MLQIDESDRRCHWREMQLERTDPFPTEEPAERRIGDAWYDASSSCLFVWSGEEWICVPLD